MAETAPRLPGLPSAPAPDGPAAMGALAAGVADGVAAAAAEVPAEARDLASAAFDAARRPAPVTPAAADPGPQLPDYLSVASPEDRGWLAETIAAAQRTRTGRRVLQELAELSLQTGRKTVIEVEDLRANNGEWIYGWGLVRMARSYRGKDPALAAPFLVHELLHVIQTHQDVPVSSVEMELEAFVVTARVFRELGLRPAAGEFAAGAWRSLRRSPKAFIRYVGKGYEKDVGLLDGSSMEDVIENLRGKARNARRRIARGEKRLAAKRATLQGLRDAGQPEALTQRFEAEEVLRHERDLAEAKNDLSWIERDLRLLGTPEGRARYADYARRVAEFIRRAHLSLR